MTHIINLPPQNNGEPPARGQGGRIGMSDKPVIEKGIPIPPKSGVGRKPGVFYRMEIGDSVFLPDVSMKVVSSRTGHARKNLGFKFTARTLEGGVRIWRIK